MFQIIQKRKIWLTFSTILMVASIISLIVFGLKLGIDFTGGSLLEVEFSEDRPTNEEISNSLFDLELINLYVQPIGEKGVILRTEAINEEKHQQILNTLKDNFSFSKISEELDEDLVTVDNESIEVGAFEFSVDDEPINEVTEVRFDSIGPIIGQELKSKAIIAIILVLIAIILYLAYAFRKVSKPIPSWQYGLAAVFALVHDILIVTGIFSILGYFFNVTVDAFFVTALLTILGFSVHDTIVTFDRIRENIFRRQDKTFEDVINISINETITRSINTSLTTIFVLLAIYLFGGATIKFFVLALILGVIAGTYSSIFVACPLLLIWFKLKK